MVGSGAPEARRPRPSHKEEIPAMNLATILGDVVGVAANPVTGLAKVALDVAPEIASWFGDDDGDDKSASVSQSVTRIAEVVRSLTGTDDPAKAKEALSDPNLVFQLRQLAAQQAHTERMAQLAARQETLKASLADIESARARDTALQTSGRGNMRANIMLGIAVCGLVTIVALLLLVHVNGESTVGGFIISVGSLLAAKVGTAFDFEFGSSAGSVEKSKIIAELQKPA